MNENKENNEFKEYLKSAAKIVNKWPQWMKEIFSHVKRNKMEECPYLDVKRMETWYIDRLYSSFQKYIMKEDAEFKGICSCKYRSCYNYECDCGCNKCLNAIICHCNCKCRKCKK